MYKTIFICYVSMSKFAKKIGSDKSYVRPNKTYQEKLTPEQIAEKLEGYEKVKDIADVPLNTHIRYFKINKDKSQKYCNGGFLHNKSNPDKFIMLSNGTLIWSVQTKSSIFFKKISRKEEIDAIHQDYANKIDKLKRYIKMLREENKKLKKNL